MFELIDEYKFEELIKLNRELQNREEAFIHLITNRNKIEIRLRFDEIPQRVIYCPVDKKENFKVYLKNDMLCFHISEEFIPIDTVSYLNR